MRPISSPVQVRPTAHRAQDLKCPRSGVRLVIPIGLILFGMFVTTPNRPGHAQVGCPATGAVSLSSNPTRIGQTLTLDLQGPANSPFALFGAFDPGPSPTPFGPICVSTNPNPPASFQIFVNSIQGAGPTLDGSGQFSLTRNVPNSPGLVGRRFYMQAATSSGGVVFSNSLTLIIGEAGTHQAPLNTLGEAKTLHDVSVLDNGDVLITGGGAGSLTSPVASDSAEVYSTAFKEVRAVGTMQRLRALHAQVTLDNGRVLICGGLNSAGVVHTTAEEYDPITETFSLVGSMGSRRAGHTATLLADGRVLVVGGTTNFSDAETAFASALDTAELYDPNTQAFSAAANTLGEARLLGSATRLQDDRVLIAGGVEDAAFLGLPLLASSGERFDPTTDMFSSVGSLDTTRAAHGAVLLPDGRVLLAGGINGFGSAQAAAELYTDGAGFAPTGNLPIAKAGTMLAVLQSGDVLETGGLTGSLLAPAGVVNCSEYRPANSNFFPTGDLNEARGGHRVIRLSDGSVLSIGGAANDTTVLDTIERYYP